MRVHVSDRINGKYGGFYTLHQLDEEDKVIEPYIQCCVNEKYMRDTVIETGDAAQIVGNVNTLKWKDSTYGPNARMNASPENEMHATLIQILNRLTALEKKIGVKE